jgi:hypothetical protein
MRQLLKVLSAMSPLHRHQLLEEARQRGSVDRNHAGVDVSRFSARSCSTCSYFMRGIKLGAFHSLRQNVYTANDCPDWELKK